MRSRPRSDRMRPACCPSRRLPMSSTHHHTPPQWPTQAWPRRRLLCAGASSPFSSLGCQSDEMARPGGYTRAAKSDNGRVAEVSCVAALTQHSYVDCRGRHVSDRMLELTRPGPGERVHELAYGTGGPARPPASRSRSSPGSHPPSVRKQRHGEAVIAAEEHGPAHRRGAEPAPHLVE